MFIVSLATADLTVGLVVMPVSAVYIFAVDWPFGLVVCQFWLAVDYTASTASILNLLVLSVDRYRSVTDPLRYLQRRTSRHAASLIAVAWTLSALWVLPIVCWHWVFSSGQRSVPPRVCDTEYAHNAALKIGTALVNYYVPLAIMAVLYGRIFVAIRRRSKLEIWQNAVVVAGGERNTSATSNHPGTGRASRTLRASDDDERYQKSPADVSSTSSQNSDNEKRTVYRFSGDTSAVEDGSRVQVQTAENSRDDELEGGSTGINKNEDSTPTSTPIEQQKSSLIDVHRKCVRFLLVASRHQSDSNEDDLDHIEMWSVPPTDSCSEATNGERSSDGGGLRTRLLRRLRRRGGPTGHHHRRRDLDGGAQKTNISLSSETKAAKQLGVIMGAFCVCFLPYFVCFVVVAFCPLCVDDRLMAVVTWIGYVNSTLNPFLYPLCNRQFRISFRRMFAELRHCRSDAKRPAPVSV